MIDDIETNRVNDRSALSVDVQVEAIAWDRWSITAWYRVIENLNRPTEESEHVWIGKQFPEITRAHSQSWHANVNSFRLVQLIMSIVKEEEGAVL